MPTNPFRRISSRPNANESGEKMSDTIKMNDFLRANLFTVGGSAVESETGTVHCSGSGWAVRSFTLNQPEASPVRIVCESRSENADGNNAYEYSLLAKIEYADGTTNRASWAPFNDGTLHYTDYLPFDRGTHDWRKNTLILNPAKPIRKVDATLLFRNHTGTAEFRGLELKDSSRLQVKLFDFMPVDPAALPREGLILRDVSTGLIAPGLAGIQTEIRKETRGNADLYRVLLNLQEPADSDRVFTLYFLRPISQHGAVMHLPGIAETPIVAGRDRDYGDFVFWGIGANGFCARTPFVAVDNGETGSAIGFDPEHPAFARLAYSGTMHALYAAFDLALTPEKRSVELSFACFRFNRGEDFRGALTRYMELYPEAYRVRARKQGNWMPFAPISELPHWEDFHFQFKEGDGEPEWDRAHGIDSFRYTEPMTYWMNMPDGVNKDAASISAYRAALAADENSPRNRQAKMLESSSMTGSDGRDERIALDRPWCRGAVWSVNSSPRVTGDLTDFKLKWNDEVAAKHYTPGAKLELSGEYVDSCEGYVTATIGHRRDQFSTVDFPLTFSAGTHLPGIFKGGIAFEYIRELRDEMHARGKLTMANGTPGAMWFLPPLLDVAGIETDWNPEGKWEPMSVAELRFRRSACGAKPYCLLMNTNFRLFSAEMSVKYMKRALAFGIFPGFFSADAATGQYFRDPALYERDRAAFVRYLPIVRQLAEAGWQVLTDAVCDDAGIALERFGKEYLTVFNESAEEKLCSIELSGAWKNAIRAENLLDGAVLPIENGKLRFSLRSEDVAAFQLNIE